MGRRWLKTKILSMAGVHAESIRQLVDYKEPEFGQSAVWQIFGFNLLNQAIDSLESSGFAADPFREADRT